MLRARRLPASLIELQETFRPCFTTPTFTTFVMLAAGLVGPPSAPDGVRDAGRCRAGRGVASQPGAPPLHAGVPIRWVWQCCGW
jgi:hypothetical protein